MCPGSQDIVTSATGAQPDLAPNSAMVRHAVSRDTGILAPEVAFHEARARITVVERLTYM